MEVRVNSNFTAKNHFTLACCILAEMLIFCPCKYGCQTIKCKGAVGLNVSQDISCPDRFSGVSSLPPAIFQDEYLN
jgi:hypothetical protein